MTPWILVPCLVSLRDEFNRVAPNRDKRSDGSIGDKAHELEESDHNPDETGRTPYEDADSTNEVHAIDVDDDLRNGVFMQVYLDIIVHRHRTGADNRLQNIIYNRRIISRSWSWKGWRAYTGRSPHTEHAHFSARYTTAQERDTRPWGIEDYMTPEDKQDIIDGVLNGLDQAVITNGRHLGPTLNAMVTESKLNSAMDVEGVPNIIYRELSNFLRSTAGKQCMRDAIELPQTPR